MASPSRFAKTKFCSQLVRGRAGTCPNMPNQFSGAPPQFRDLNKLHTKLQTSFSFHIHTKFAAVDFISRPSSFVFVSFLSPSSYSFSLSSEVSSFLGVNFFSKAAVVR